MKVTFGFSSALAQQIGGVRELVVAGETNAEVFKGLAAANAKAAALLFTPTGEVQPFVHLFLNDKHFHLGQPLKDDDRIDVVGALAGG